MIKPYRIILVKLSCLCILSGSDDSKIIQVAVASNFSATMNLIVKHFEDQTDYKVYLIYGSTGKHYAQIKQGAPIDLFFAADVRRPKILDDEGLGIFGTRFTYAIGRIILWSADKDFIDPKGDILLSSSVHKIAIANPDLAPYGRAAREFLEHTGIWHKLKMKIVMGENIGQTFHFVNSGNTDLGFVSVSQIKRTKFFNSGSSWEIPDSLYSPILQDAILLKESNVGREFINFVKGPKSKNIILQFGYRVPDYE